jgi:hypothetical protein
MSLSPPVGLVWRVNGTGYIADSPDWTVFVLDPAPQVALDLGTRPDEWRWGVRVLAVSFWFVLGDGEATTLEAAKAAAESCLRTWVARLNASLGGTP